MKIDIVRYSNRVFDSFTSKHSDSLVENNVSKQEMRDIISDIMDLTDDHTIKDFDIDIIGDGEFIDVKLDIGQFYEDRNESAFIRLLKRCTKFEVHPGELTKLIFTFNGIWEEKNLEQR